MKTADKDRLSLWFIIIHTYLYDGFHGYRIYSAIRRGFHLSRMTTNNLISSM